MPLSPVRPASSRVTIARACGSSANEVATRGPRLQSRTQTSGDVLECVPPSLRTGAFSGPPKRARILSLDGGGIWTVREARIVQELEARASARLGRSVHISELVHMVTGNSAGAMLAAGLTRPKPLSGRTLTDLFRHDSRQMFARSLWYRLRSLEGTVLPKYPSSGIDGILERLLGETTLSQAVVDLLIPTHDVDRGPMLLTSWAMNADAADYRARDVVRGSAAVPSYFRPAHVRDVKGGGIPLHLVDGGAWSNNPTPHAIMQAKERYAKADSYLVLSLGCGQIAPTNVGETAARWGLLRWLPSLAGMFFNTSTLTAQHLATMLLDLDGKDIYMRLNPPIQRAATDAARGVSDSFDDADPENVERHIAQTEAFITENSAQIDAIVEELLEPMCTREELLGAPAARRGITPLSARALALSPTATQQVDLLGELTHTHRAPTHHKV